MDIFQKAAMQALRYSTNRGAVATEDLFAMQLSGGGFSLDGVARVIARELKDLQEESFVETSTNPVKAELELKLEIVKAVIKHKQETNAAKANEATRRAEKQKLLGLLSHKKDEELASLSTEELEKRIAELS